MPKKAKGDGKEPEDKKKKRKHGHDGIPLRDLVTAVAKSSGLPRALPPAQNNTRSCAHSKLQRSRGRHCGVHPVQCQGELVGRTLPPS